MYLVLDILPLHYQFNRERLLFIQKILMNDKWSQHTSTVTAIDRPESLKKGWLMESSHIWLNMELANCNKVELQSLCAPWTPLKLEIVIENSILNKARHDPNDLQVLHNNLLEKYGDEESILYFSDGSNVFLQMVKKRL